MREQYTSLKHIKTNKQNNIIQVAARFQPQWIDLEGSTASRSCRHLEIITGSCASSQQHREVTPAVSGKKLWKIEICDMTNWFLLNLIRLECHAQKIRSSPIGLVRISVLGGITNGVSVVRGVPFFLWCRFCATSERPRRSKTKLVFKK